MKKVQKNLYQFTMNLPSMNFTIHQYLFDCACPFLISTGTKEQAETILPQIKNILNEKALKYILISHMESDECGGLQVFLTAYPDACVICSELTARELYGYGIKAKIRSCSEKDMLQDKDLCIRFIDYPSEVHLQNGLLFIEMNSNIFFSSDLMLRFGMAEGQVLNSTWEHEIDSINGRQIPIQEKRKQLKTKLLSFTPRFIAVGHGYCITLD